MRGRGRKRRKESRGKSACILGKKRENKEKNPTRMKRKYKTNYEIIEGRRKNPMGQKKPYNQLGGGIKAPSKGVEGSRMDVYTTNYSVY